MRVDESNAMQCYAPQAAARSLPRERENQCRLLWSREASAFLRATLDEMAVVIRGDSGDVTMGDDNCDDINWEESVLVH